MIVMQVVLKPSSPRVPSMQLADNFYRHRHCEEESYRWMQFVEVEWEQEIGNKLSSVLVFRCDRDMKTVKLEDTK